MNPIYIPVLKDPSKDLSRNETNSIVNSPTDNFLGGIPLGGIITFPGEQLPYGYLWCDGTIYYKSAYEELYLALSNNGETTTWNITDNPTQFSVPDLRGRVVKGWGYSTPQVGTKEDEQVGTHEHNVALRNSPNTAATLGAIDWRGGSNAAVAHYRYSKTDTYAHPNDQDVYVALPNGNNLENRVKSLICHHVIRAY